MISFKQGNRKIPKLFFKFKSLSTKEDVERVSDIVNNNRLYFPTCYQLNDPFEGCYFELPIAHAGASIALIEDRDYAPLNDYKKEYHILSLSTNCFSPQLWAYYCNNYNGVCFCYLSNLTLHNAQKVIYKHNKKQIIKANDTRNNLEIIRNSFLIKQKEWQSEKEWRIIEHYQKNSGIHKYINYDAKELIGVILGSNVDDKITKEILDALPKHVKVFRTYPGIHSCEINLLDYYFEFEGDGSQPPFIKTVDELYSYIV